MDISTFLDPLYFDDIWVFVFAIMIETGIDIHAQVFRYAFLFSFGEYLE